MNYRHAFHAGNFADVMKHAFVARILQYLSAKPGAWRFIDTHAGSGIYDLAASSAQRTGEWLQGIARFEAYPLPADASASFAPYLNALASVRRAGATLYPGSPALAQALARAQDRLSLAELHPEEAAALDARLGGDRRVKVFDLDGWTMLKAAVPPIERRGLVLIDPPFEEADDWSRLIVALETAYRRWATGIFAIWYPIKQQSAVRRLHSAVIATGIRKVLVLELLIDDPADETRLNGSGLLVVNPPFVLAGEAEPMLRILVDCLARSSKARSRVAWLSGE